MRENVNSSSPHALLFSSESMTENSSFLVKDLIENTGTCSLSRYLKAMAEPLKNPRTAIDIFRQLMIFV